MVVFRSREWNRHGLLRVGSRRFAQVLHPFFNLIPRYHLTLP